MHGEQSIHSIQRMSYGVALYKAIIGIQMNFAAGRKKRTFLKTRNIGKYKIERSYWEVKLNIEIVHDIEREIV